VEGFGEIKPLCYLQTQRMNVGNEQKEPGEFLAARNNTKLGCLLDRIGGVAASIGHADNLGLGRLRLQQERGKIGGVERMLDAANDFAARLYHDSSCIALQRRPESIVGGQKKPGVTTGLHQSLTG